MLFHPMQPTVLISTHERPSYLERTLAGMAGQVFPPHEVLIADDGSGEETREVIRRFRATVRFPVVHVRQEHVGWGKCSILNKCLLESSGDYFVFTDGDCIHRRDWLRGHVRSAAPARILGGGDLRLNRAVSDRITVDDVLAHRPFSALWLMQNGMKWRRSLVKAFLPRSLAPITDAINFMPARFSGSNASCWKSDAMRVDGFDERFGWGKEDVEFGLRIRHTGAGTRHVRYVAACFHMDHPRDSAITRQMVDSNFEMLREVVQERRTKAERGVSKTGREYTVERENPAIVTSATPGTPPRIAPEPAALIA
ncbi:MAG: glycosyltransferase [Phycisphaerales bacterium]